MTEKKPPPRRSESTKAAAGERQQRLAQALRDNLRRRKGQKPSLPTGGKERGGAE
ncbi:MAG: hypothetical protein QF384_03390 [Alphaproteobacteria bacterium]|jgi:hypothetical protein|nr:hypothetical protein [Alphaproteobacteria bacterium]MDP6876178.1 hypothetical protein [Alphaproteobacteria bacterium]